MIYFLISVKCHIIARFQEKSTFHSLISVKIFISAEGFFHNLSYQIYFQTKRKSLLTLQQTCIICTLISRCSLYVNPRDALHIDTHGKQVKMTSSPVFWTQIFNICLSIWFLNTNIQHTSLYMIRFFKFLTS